MAKSKLKTVQSQIIVSIKLKMRPSTCDSCTSCGKMKKKDVAGHDDKPYERPRGEPMASTSSGGRKPINNGQQNRNATKTSTKQKRKVNKLIFRNGGGNQQASPPMQGGDGMARGQGPQGQHAAQITLEG